MSSAAQRKASKVAKDKQIAQVAPASRTAVALAGIPENFKVTRALQLPTLVMKKEGEGRQLAFLSGLRVSTVPPKPKESPATVATVADMETGEEMTFLVPAVVESILCDTYGPRTAERVKREDVQGRDEIYQATEITNRCFFIRNDGKKEGKRHVDFTVLEGESLKVAA